jgi:hypothetical protein
MELARLVPVHFSSLRELYIKAGIVSSSSIDDTDIAFDFNQWVFQHDSVRPHIRKDIMEVTDKLAIRLLKGWPL